ncbi:MAG: hypothetical protein KAU17_11215 [Spirochaetales bacterium]|nr:hypothetical protein [Spirochaetales bacterium]
MKTLKKTAFIILTVFLASCGDGLFFDMDRVNRDPVVSEPIARSFIDEYKIYLTWDEDEAADEYVLYRAEDTAFSTYSIVYQGTDTAFTDSDCGDEKRYLYTLGKIKGQQLFGPSEPVLGVGSSVCRDEHEENDCKNLAVPLLGGLTANIFYYQDSQGNSIEDIDWYSITIPPHMRANILIVQTSFIGDPSQNSPMVFYLEGSDPYPIVSDATNPVENLSNEEKTYLFRVSPDPSEFVSNPDLSGGALIDYTMTLHSMNNL